MTLHGLAVAAQLSVETGFEFAGSQGRRADGVRWFELVPAHYPRTQTFSILAEVGWRRIDVIFSLGSFAGDLLSAMQTVDDSCRSVFASVLDSCQDAGAEIFLLVNGTRRGHRDSGIWSVPWTTFEFRLTRGMLPVDEGRGHLDDNLVKSWMGRVAAAALALLPLDGPSEENREPVGWPEGATISIAVNRFERDRRNRAAALAIHGHLCIACEKDLGERYGPVAKGLIEVHHVVPIAEMGGEYVINPKSDLVPLCPDCHTVAHQRTPPFTVCELKVMLRSGKVDGRTG